MAAYWLSGLLIVGGGTLLILRHTVWPGRPADPPGELASAASILSVRPASPAPETS
jgi:hypothetical protein